MVFPVEPNFSRDAVKLLDLTNQLRERHDLRTLTRHRSLDLAAQWMAKDMWLGKYFSHTDRKGRTAYARAKFYGWPEVSTVGENIFFNHPTTPQRVIDGWMDSPGHRENLLQPGWLNVGVGVLMGHYVAVYGRIG